MESKAKLFGYLEALKEEQHQKEKLTNELNELKKQKQLICVNNKVKITTQIKVEHQNSSSLTDMSEAIDLHGDDSGLG